MNKLFYTTQLKRGIKQVVSRKRVYKFSNWDSVVHRKVFQNLKEGDHLILWEKKYQTASWDIKIKVKGNGEIVAENRTD